MQATHKATISVGNNNYDYELTTITKTYAGLKKDNEGTTIYLEDERGKVETVRSDFDIEIPPTTREISLLYVDGKKKGMIRRFGFYLHSNDYVGYLTQQAKANTAKNAIKLNGWKAKLEKWQWAITLCFALFCAWNALFTGIHFDRYGYSLFFTEIPYVILRTPYFIAEFDYLSKSYGYAFGAFVISFFVGKFLFNFPVNRLRNKIYSAFGNDLEDRLPKIFDAHLGGSPFSSSPNTVEKTKPDSDGFQPLV